MKDKHGRDIGLSEDFPPTDRCNLRCIYCMPEEGVEITFTRRNHIHMDEILSYLQVRGAELGESAR